MMFAFHDVFPRQLSVDRQHSRNRPAWGSTEEDDSNDQERLEFSTSPHDEVRDSCCTWTTSTQRHVRQDFLGHTETVTAAAVNRGQRYLFVPLPVD